MINKNRYEVYYKIFDEIETGAFNDANYIYLFLYSLILITFFE